MIRHLFTLLLLMISGCTTVSTPPLYHQMDETDIQLANQALMDALQTRTKNQTVTWFNPTNRHSGIVMPVNTFRHTNGQWCRNYSEQLYIDTRSQQWRDTACRQEDGRWLPLRK